MKKKLLKNKKFLKEFLSSPSTIGAISPSSQFLAKAMVKNIDFSKAKYIIEYGSGFGVFTEHIIENMNNKSTLILIEFNYKFYRFLSKKYINNKNVLVIHDSAENLEIILKEKKIYKIDLVFSGLPFSSFPVQMTENIFNKTIKYMNKNSKFILFQYSLYKIKLLKHFFKITNIKLIIRNLPPAFVIKLKRK